MKNHHAPKKRSRTAASALVPLFVIAGLLLGPAATATAAAPTARQAPASAALHQGPLASGAGEVTVLGAPASSRVQATTGNKKKKKKSKKKGGGFFKTLLVILLLAVVILAIVFVVRMLLRRRSA
ncbi:hypothetical protein ACIA8F_15545 [Streptomyces sp. NPDC051563]|uniref:hypothetical protein n=1 Tax=Streptomyces sp. NPDC051563 TaxID=3365659 RepID=UPI003794E011